MCRSPSAILSRTGILATVFDHYVADINVRYHITVHSYVLSYNGSADTKEVNEISEFRTEKNFKKGRASRK